MGQPASSTEARLRQQQQENQDLLQQTRDKIDAYFAPKAAALTNEQLAEAGRTAERG